MPDQLTNGEKEYLLKIARATLEKRLVDGEVFEPQTTNQTLWQKGGVFVTLTNKGELRGCIGYIEPVEPLILAVRDNVLSAAGDPRFLPVRSSELQNIVIEISILTEPKKVKFANIKKGDGVIIKKGKFGATYLPSVWKQLPKKKEFFSSLCQKAGLDADCYTLDGLDFYCYETVVFSEK